MGTSNNIQLMPGFWWPCKCHQWKLLSVGAFTGGWWSKQVSLSLAVCWRFCLIIPRQSMKLFKVFWPMYFKPIVSFKPHLIWGAKIHQSSCITLEEQLWLTTVSSVSVTCLLILMYWSLRVLDLSTIFSWSHPEREAFPLLWRFVLEKRQQSKGKTLHFGKF